MRIEGTSQEVEVILTELRDLYLLERHARDESQEPEQRLRLRSELSAPILAPLKRQSPLGRAVKYALA